MNYEEFISAIMATGLCVPNNQIVTWEWTTGGSRGSTCYGDKLGDFDVEAERDHEELDEILESTAPSISHLQYKRLIRDLLHYTQEQEDSYYGRHRRLGRKKILLKELYEWLKTESLLRVAPVIKDERKV